MNYRYVCTLLLICCACSKKQPLHPQRKNIVETVYASGTVIAENEYTIYSLVSGTIEKKLVSDGDSVGKDQVLYIVRNDAPTSRMDAAKALYENSTRNLSESSPVLAELRLAMQNAESKFHTDSLQYLRYKKLFEDGVITRSQFDDATTVYTISRNQRQSASERYTSTLHDLRVAASTSKSQLAVAQNDLNNFFVKSDAVGTVFQMFKQVGETVRLNEPIALLGAKDRRTIKLAVDQQDIDKIVVGNRVLLKTDITGNKIFEAKIVKIYPVMNIADQTFRVDAEYVDASPTSFVHSSLEANIVIAKKDNALVIPRSLLVAGDSVLVSTDGKKKMTSVKVGISTLDDVEIISGIDEKTELVSPND